VVNIVEPESVFALRTQPSASPPAATIDRTEARILETLRENGVIKVWTLLGILCQKAGPPDRSSACRLRLELLRRVRILREKGLVYGVGRNSIALEKPEPKRRQRRALKWKRSAARLRMNQAVRAPICPPPPAVSDLKVQVELQVDTKAAPNEGFATKPTKTQSARDTGDVRWQPFSFSGLLATTAQDSQAGEANSAASALARRPRGQGKRWSGYLDPKDKTTRLWRGRELLTPAGRVVNAVGCLRGLVLVEWADPFAIDGRSHQVFKASELEVHRNPAAVALGRRKQGKKEMSSARKSETARRNGCAPCRPGSRPRGRPRRVLAHP